MNRDEAMAACLARGLHRAECDELVADRMLDGSYCDGSIVLDEHGSRCIDAGALAARRETIARDPLVRAVEPKGPPSGLTVPLVLSLAWRALFGLADYLGVE